MTLYRSSNVYQQLVVSDTTARTTDMIQATMGSATTPVTTEHIAPLFATIYSSAENYGLGSTYTSQGIPADKLGAGSFTSVTTHAGDNAGGTLAGFQTMINTTAGTTAGNAAFLANATGAGMYWKYILSSENGADINMYKSVNDGNPSWTFGASATEKFSVQAVYDGGAQTLDYVEFTTAAASATADKGKYVFDVDGTDVLTIGDVGPKTSPFSDADFDNTDVLTTTIPNTAYGLLIVRESTATEACVFLIAGGTIEKLGTDATFTVTKDNLNTYNVYFETNVIKVQNNVGDNKNIAVGLYGI